MDGMWYKLCPQCRNYIKKTSPQDSGICCACGWEEYPVTHFCEIVDKYCEFYPSEPGDKLAA